jgi:hypothetical protein
LDGLLSDSVRLPGSLPGLSGSVLSLRGAVNRGSDNLVRESRGRLGLSALHLR